MEGPCHELEPKLPVRIEVGLVLIVVLRVTLVHSVKIQETDRHRDRAKFQGPVPSNDWLNTYGLKI